MSLKSSNSFWDLFLKAQAKSLPTESDIYLNFQKFHKEYRNESRKTWSKFYDRTLPKATISFYNGLFKEIDQTTQDLLKPKNVSQAARMRAKEFYGFRLKSTSTLNDLLKTDIFGEKTMNLDIKIEEALSGKFKVSPALLLKRKASVYHYYLHRPQQSEFLFLHELLVGYMGNAIINESKVPRRNEVELLSGEYWQLPAYITVALSEQLQLTVPQTLELHFLTNDEVKVRLPKFFQELMLVSSHLYWYLDRYALQSQAIRSPVTLLSMISHFYFIPLMEQSSKSNNMRLKKSASKAIDKLFYDKLYESHPEEGYFPGDYDIATTLQALQKETFSF